MFSNFLKGRFTLYLNLLIFLLSASAATAQTTLTTTDGNVTINGQLLGLDDKEYRIKTAAGELLIRREFVTCSGAGCPEVESDGQTDGDEVTLKSADGTIEVKGTLADVTKTEFVIDTVMGRLTVRRELISCEGESCPGIVTTSDRFMVSVSNAEDADLLTAIIADFTSAKDFNLTQQFNSDSGNELPTLLIGDEKGLEVARISTKQMETPAAVAALINGESQFAITREQITPEILSNLLNKDVSDIEEHLNEEIIGLDAITFVVSESNGIDVINLEVVRAVLDGQITNWAQLGGADEPINLHTLAENKNIVEKLGDSGFGDLANLRGAIKHTSAEALNEAVSANPNAIGVIYRSQKSGVKALNLESPCNIIADNSEFSIQTEEHPLAMRWYQYSLNEGASSEFARNVERFIPTDFGQQTMVSRGMVTQQLQIVPMQDQGARVLSAVLSGSNDRASNTVMKTYFTEASNARRISTSMRFLSGRAVLDSKAESDIDRISEIVRSSEYEGYEVLVFGFSDSIGKLQSNLNLSQRRADSVREILLQRNSGYLDTETVLSFGIGPIAPVGCNQFVDGRESNRRVEIWIRPRA